MLGKSTRHSRAGMNPCLVEDMPVAKMSTNGRITLPSILRKRLRLQAGDKIKFVQCEDGYLLQVIKSVRSLRGILNKTNTPPDITKMNQAIADAVVNNYKEIK